jgi:hypothetical protein
MQTPSATCYTCDAANRAFGVFHARIKLDTRICGASDGKQEGRRKAGLLAGV